MLAVEIQNKAPDSSDYNNERTDTNLKILKIAWSLFSVVYIWFKGHIQQAHTLNLGNQRFISALEVSVSL